MKLRLLQKLYICKDLKINGVWLDPLLEKGGGG